MHTFQAPNLVEDRDNYRNYQENGENVPRNHDTDRIRLAMKGHREPIIEQLMKQMSAM